MAIIVDNKTSAIEKIHTLNCLNEVERLEQYLNNERSPRNPPFEYNMPTLPEWTNENLEFDGQIMNLYELSCNCNHSQSKRRLFPKHDLRSVCKHIYKKISTSEMHKNAIDDLSFLLIYSIVFEEEKMLIVSKSSNDQIFYIGGRSNTKIYNVYAENNHKWKKYMYSTLDNKWKDGNYPENRKIIIETLYRNEFVFDKYLRGGN